MPPLGGGHGTGSSGFTVDRVVRFVLGAGALAGAAFLVWYFAGLVAYLVAGTVIAYLLKPFVDALEGRGLPRIGAILLVVGVTIGLLSVVLTNLLPFLARQVQEMAQQLTPETVIDVANRTEGWLQQRFPLREGALTEAAQRGVETLFQDQLLSTTLGSLLGVVSNVFYAVLVIPFVMFFALKDGTAIRHAIVRPVPNRYFEVVIALIVKVESNLGRYFRALLLQCTLVATVATITLQFAGLHYALAIGIFTGLANSIPYFGPAIGALSGTVVAIAQTGDFTIVPGVVVAMAITQLIDNAFFYPLIFARAARTHPLVILFVVLVAAQLGGIIGMLLAIPTFTIIRVTIEQVLWSLRNYRILNV